MSANHYTYRVTWSPEDDEFVATVVEFPSLSWLAADQATALQGLVELVDSVIADLAETGDEIPSPLSERTYSGRLNIRVPEGLHRELAVEAAEQHISLNRLVSDKLARRDSTAATA